MANKNFSTEAEVASKKMELRNALTKENILNLDVVIVHDGSFHLDDVMVVVLIMILRLIFGATKKLQIKRANRNDITKIVSKLEKQHKNYFIADMGGGLWDHHDLVVVRYPDDENLTLTKRGDILKAQRKAEPYTASSKLWNFAIGPILVGETFTAKIDNEFFRLLDGMDNFGSIPTQYGNVPNPMSIAVKRMNGCDISDNRAQRRAFDKAVKFMTGVFMELLESYIKQKEVYEKNGIGELENSENTIIVLDKFIASTCFDPAKTHFIVEPNKQDGWWQVSSTCSELYPIIERSELSGHIRAQLDIYDIKVDCGELKTQKPFFHKTGFLAVVPTKELAIAIANESEMIVAVEK